ncbi:unnamed protein product [Rhodiola kirilowii]
MARRVVSRVFKSQRLGQIYRYISPPPQSPFPLYALCISPRCAGEASVLGSALRTAALPWNLLGIDQLSLS